MEFNEQQARWQYKLLGHEGFCTRLRSQDMENGHGNETLVEGEEAFIEWCKTLNGKRNLFIGRNPRDKKGNIIRATCVTLDIDPVRPAKEASSELQHSAALELGRTILSVCGPGNLCSSGNGALLIFPLEQPVTVDLDDFKIRCKLFEDSIRSDYETSNLKVDSTHDLARLLKVVGSVSTKGDRTQWRRARFLHPPIFRVQQSKLTGILRSFDISRESTTGLVLP